MSVNSKKTTWTEEPASLGTPCRARITRRTSESLTSINPGLAWFYIAPGCADTESCRRLLTFARDLLGPNAWAVLQSGDAQCHALCRELGLRVVASYLNEADGSSSVSAHIVQTIQPGDHL